MNKKKLLPLVIGILVCLLICTFTIVISAQADTPSLTIKAYNLIFGESVYITYAVDARNMPTDAKAELLIWEKLPEKYEKGTEDVVLSATDDRMSVGGVMCDTYVFDSIVARQMATDFYAVAHVNVGGVDYYSAPRKYSVLQYIYNKMGITGTPSDKPTFIELLQMTLEYGGAVQRHFDADNPRHANKTFYQVKVSGGTLSDGFNSGLYLEGDTVTVSAPTVNASGTGFAYWTDSDGRIVSTSPTFETEKLYEHKTYTANYTGAKTYTVDFVGMDGQLIKSQTVAGGANATAPTPPTVKGYEFVGWSGAYTNITTDTTVTAEYDIVHNQLFFSMTDNGDGTVTVTLSLEGDVNLYGLECKIYLETEGMEYTSLKSVATGLMANKKSDYIILSYATADGRDVTEPHTLLSVTFTKVAENVSVSASLSDVDAFDQSFVSESYSVADDFCG